MKRLSIITILGVIAVGVIAFLIYKNQQKLKNAGEKTKTPANGGSPTITQAAAGGGGSSATTQPQPISATAPGLIIFTGAQKLKILKKGITGDEVKALQATLNHQNAGLILDGNFGNATEAALLKQFGKTSVSLDWLKINALTVADNIPLTEHPYFVGSFVPVWEDDNYNNKLVWSWGA